MPTRPPPTLLCNRCQRAFEPRELRDYPYAKIGRGVPSEVEGTQILNAMEAEEAEMQRYDEELGKLRGIVEKLESERTALQESISRKRGLLSASRKIPQEVWDIIFKEVVESGTGYSGYSGIGYSLRLHYEHPDYYLEGEDADGQPGQVEAPTHVLSQVSSHWRQLVHSMPHLWSSISVDLFGLEMDPCPILEIYFRNSGSYHLTFEILDTRWLSRNPDDELMELTENGCAYKMLAHRVLTKLVPKMDRCKRLQFSLSDDGGICRLDYPLPPSFPILEHFTYKKYYGEPTEPDWLPDRILHAAEGVKDMTILRYFDTIPVTNLTSLTITSEQGLRPLLNALTMCTQLVTLAIHSFEVRSGEMIPVPVELFSLRSLFITSEYAGEPLALIALFSVLTVPSLITLKLRASSSHWVEEYSDWPWQTLYDMLRRSSCPLQELLFSTEAGLVSDHQGLIQVLGLFPQSLKRLRIEIYHPRPLFMDVLYNLLDALTFPTSSSERALVLPRLEVFSLWMMSNADLPRPELARRVLDMGESRTRHRTWQMGDRVSSLSSLSLVIHKTRYLIQKEAEARVPPFVPPLMHIRRLTATGMACTMEERIDHTWEE
ncbi:hypothetical protein WG66_007706 [Moniliophthora roreri]|uniref:F-box domain-containing protein n=1 Tax=Moniliophthora roreri TaxID=221103 RepID=A0A0W0F3Y1_MONRR|nr:hypothetical protein WG66_007706 [Moniliophthora roreri]